MIEVKNRFLAAINKDLLTTDAILRDVKDIPDELAIQIQQVSNNPKVAGQMIVRNGGVVKLTSYNLGKNPLTPSNTDGKYDKIDIEELAESISQQLFENVMETASTNQGGAGEMENVYQKLIDRLDQDIRDHKQEVRDRDAQYQRDAQEREERFMKYFDDKFDNHKKLLDERFKNMDSNIQDIKNEMTNVTNRVDQIHSRVDGLKYFIVGSTITLLIGIAGVVYANWQVISSILSLAK